MNSGRALRMAYLVAGVAGVGFFALSILLLGVWPSRVLEAEIERQAPGHTLPLTASELRGRQIYSSEGCAYCHTQQVRYLERDVERFGAATLAWETNLDFPHLWGTRRIGPDLSREAGVRSNDWQLAHLFAPRGIVAGSVMPAFPHLFSGAPDRPRQQAQDLLAYLNTLGRARELAGPEGEKHAREACSNCEADISRFAFEAAALNTNPAKQRPSGVHPPLDSRADPARGRALYAEHCASCHGSSGLGNGAAAKTLSPPPSNLAEHDYTLNRLGDVLWNGRAGTAMSAWRDLPLESLAAIAVAVQGLHSQQAEPAIPQATLALGAQVYGAHCAQCHGEQGAGDGAAARQFPVAPANLREQRPSIAASLRAVRNGVAGTSMGAWSAKLSEAEISAVAYYVRGFYAGGAQ
jgi:cbb3-type cytochrome oxidase cytochrome c subunit/mono/diheme cytochrome c family protein